MFTISSPGFVLILLALILHYPEGFSCKKMWKYKSIKKLSKSEVEVKTYVFPCFVDEEKYLNATFSSSHKHLDNCKRKLIIRMTVNSGGEFCLKSDGFIPIDHVTDGLTGRKKRLLNPIMIRLKREKMYQFYDLQLIKSINAEAKEDVINYENTPNYTGCDTSSSHPTCGFSFFNNKIIQFSEGFCCSCDQTKNDQRQPCEGHSGDTKNLPEITRYSHHHRNRSSRDLEALDLSPGSREGHKEKWKGGNVGFAQLAVQEIQPLLRSEMRKEEGTAFKSHVETGILDNHNDVLINDQRSLGEKSDTSDPPENSNAVISNLTIKTFQFEHTISPQVLNGNQVSIPNYNIIIQMNGRNSEVQNNSEGAVCSSDNRFNSTITLSKEQLRQLMMSKIKLDKIEEKESSTKACTSPDDTVKSNKEVRSLRNKLDGKISNSINKFPKGDPEGFSLKLTGGDSELNIQIVTKKAKGQGVYGYVDKSSTQSLEKYSNKSMKEKSTNGSLNNIIKLIKSQYLVNNGSDADTTEEYLQNTDTMNNTTESIKSVESIVYKLVPLINTAQSCSEPQNWEKVKINLKDSVNTTNRFLNEIQMDVDGDSVLKLEKTNVLTNKNEPAPFFSLNETNTNSSIPVQFTILKQDSGLEDAAILKYPIAVEEQPMGLLGTPSNSEEQRVEKREAGDQQIRGGQSCCQDGKQVPCNADPVTYFESAHCLRFSELWYNVHRMVNPRVENSITVKIYSKHRTNDKRICWENLTKRLPGRVGTTNEILTDDARNIVIWYSSDDKVAFSLDCSSDYILVPQAVPKKCKDTELKELSRGGPEEFLVLKENEVTMDGDDCDRAGVNYAAFSRQPHRCQRETGTCLKNQPLQFWRDDKKAAAESKPGQYFLSNFITVNEQTILQNITSGQVVIKAPYIEHYQSHVVVELNADHIDIVADRSEGEITEVYIDATSDRVTIIKAVVTNLGIAVDYFGVEFANCSHPLGPSDFDKPSKDEIPPQHRITYTATISTPVAHKRTDCNMVLYNVEQEVVAQRHIIIVQGERCMCVWHCQCVCYNYPRPGLLCTPLSIKDYNSAGFAGQPPVETGSDCSTIFVVLQGLLWFFIFLLIFGLIKALLGLCFNMISVWGLWYIMPNEAQCLYCYMEPHLSCYPLLRDSEGFPIHPRLYTRSVRFLPWYSEFALNIFFFICFARMYLCESLSRNARSVMSPNRQYYDDCSGYRRRNRSPGCSTRCGPCSPCNSGYSTRRKFRLSAGGDIQFDADPQPLKDEEEAKRYVEELARSYVVFRKFTMPVGGVKSIPGTPYSVRGFFMESENGVYEFCPPSPLIQIWTMDRTLLDPPVLLNSAPFRVMYRTASEVMRAHELTPWGHGVVINEP